MHALRSDATNATILQGSKAHVCEVTSLFHHALDSDDFGAHGDHDRHFHRCNLIKIEGSCDGPLQHAVFLKWMQSIGVSMWGQDDQDAACAAGNHVRVWVFTTMDQGPDQVAASTLLQRDVEESVADLVIAQWCFGACLAPNGQVPGSAVVQWQVLRFPRKGCQLVE